ncbi:MAG TPA: hypothetical protein VGL72_10135, partial [Bryobacteraceae bacterium]
MTFAHFPTTRRFSDTPTSAELALAQADTSRYDHSLLTSTPRTDDMTKHIQTWKVKDLKPHPRQAAF